MKYNKLVRDRIPELCRKQKLIPIIKKAEKKEMKAWLKKKLLEEVKEYMESEKTTELADILEIIYTLAREKKVSKNQLEKIRIKRILQRGAYTKRIILLETKPYKRTKR